MKTAIFYYSLVLTALGIISTSFCHPYSDPGETHSYIQQGLFSTLIASISISEGMLRMWEVMKQDEEVKEELYKGDREQDGTDDHDQAKLQGSGW